MPTVKYGQDDLKTRLGLEGYRSRGPRANCEIDPGSTKISNPVKASFLNDIPMAPPDGILKLSAMFKEDQDPRKVNLGIGAYRDDEGNPFVFQCVKDAETLLAKQTAEGKLYKEYSAIDGTPEF